MSSPLELELWMVVNYPLDTANQTSVVCNSNSKCSQPINDLSHQFLTSRSKQPDTQELQGGFNLREMPNCTDFAQKGKKKTLPSQGLLAWQSRASHLVLGVSRLCLRPVGWHFSKKDVLSSLSICEFMLPVTQVGFLQTPCPLPH